MWAMLHDIEQQCEWHGIKLADEEWKDLFSAGLVKSKVVPNLDGTGFVILGQRTSQIRP
ncbi:recombination protein NinB [Candidatus Skiveiella danica]|uniref:recombination protein NinB n=1 Tax=Candidatus Skiveiella danica TaxID=3386177 RepID=UPI0039B897E5